MKILNIAEKPSVAKSISYTLSQNVSKLQSYNKYTPNYKFKYKENEMVFTSLLGHLFTTDFVGYQDWNAADPKILFTAEIKKFVNKNQDNIKKNIQNQVYNANLVVIWTDCDREGENIGKEIYDVVREKNKHVEIKRARFNAITFTNICYAFDNLTNINLNDSEAVDTRIELDLRIGSAFTRLQSLNLEEKMVLSYGSCQIPTLGFVVARMVEIENFVAEKYYSLELLIREAANVHKNKTNSENGSLSANKAKRSDACGIAVINDKKSNEDVFTWDRGPIYDKNLSIYVLNMMNKHSYCIIKFKNTKEVQKTKPLPLRTVEFQKACASFFKISSSEVMKIAENLYTKGYISYPRTETDVFPNKFNYKEIINLLKTDARYKSYCEKLNYDSFAYPRKGKNDDMAHSPIYPLKNGSGLSGNECKIYDFVARRFLACVSKNAVGEEICVSAEVGQELFSTKGLQILEKNYLEIYTYEKWNENKINDYKLNTKIELYQEKNNTTVYDKKQNEVMYVDKDNRYIGSLGVENKETKPPSFLTEPELISLMDKNGIGTDATIAEHIQKIQDRKYAYKRNAYIIATSLGYGLIDGYKRIGLLELPNPHLRSKLEEDLKRICEGNKNKKQVFDSELAIYMNFYDKLCNNITTVKNVILEHKENDTNKIEKCAKSKRIEEKDNLYNDFENTIKKVKNGESIQNQNPNHIKAIKQITKVQKPVNTKNVCFCKKATKVNIVTKSGVNKNKEFYSCVNWPNGCEYFEWVSNQTEKQDNTKSETKCYCGFDVQTKKSNTEQNKDRMFYCCKKAYKPCKYFAWID
ncbi:Karyopherin transporter [Binucleata daphniae]